MRSERLAFYQPITTADGFGGEEAGYQATPSFEERAEIKYLRGTDTVQQERMAGRQPIVAMIPNSSKARQITAGWRAILVRTGMPFDIKGAHITDDRREVEIMAIGGLEEQ